MLEDLNDLPDLYVVSDMAEDQEMVRELLIAIESFDAEFLSITRRNISPRPTESSDEDKVEATERSSTSPPPAPDSDINMPQAQPELKKVCRIAADLSIACLC